MSLLIAAGQKLAESAARRLKAYHGSPHDFDEFSTEAIGTGEGAQAYGRGLYFAEREGTAMSYRDSLTPRDFDYEEYLMEQYKAAESTQDYNRMDMLERAMQHDTPADFRDIASDADYDDDYRQLAADMADEIEGFVNPNGNPVNFGRMYEVDIDTSPDELLDYDLPLNEQRDEVKKRILDLELTDLDGNKYTIEQLDSLGFRGQNLYEKLSSGDDARGSARLKDVGIKGIKYADAQTRFSSKGKTSNYVIFDDKLLAIARKYGVTLPVASAILAGTMTPEQAQAGPLSQGAKRIIDQRFSNPVADSSIRKGVLANAETIPAGIEKRNMDMGGNLNIEDFEGHPYILTQSDRSAAGGTLNSINNQEIDAVNLRGGRDFMFDPASEGQVWASFPSVVDGLHSRAGELKRQTGKNPILMPYAMAPTGIDFATMPLDAMINYARQGMSKTNIKKLDSKIKKVMPNWSGVMNPDSNSQFKNVTGDTRKAVARIIDMQFRDVNGGLSMGEARAATSASDQYLIPDGSLKNAGIIDASKPVLSDSGHPTYIGGLQGEGLGRFTDSMNARAFAEANGRNITGKPNDIRALSMNHSLQQGIIDENLLRFIEKHKKKLATAGALASGGASADQAREQQKFERLEAEEQKLRAMRSSSYGKVSPELAEYRRSQLLPSIGEIGMGALEATVDGLDFLSNVPTSISRMQRQNNTPVRDMMQGILDTTFVDERDKRRREEARKVGALLSPI